MEKAEDTILVFTDESAGKIIMEGGSGEWRVNPVRAKQCKWLVCTQNQHTPYHSSSNATEPHKSGFLLGRISGLRKASVDDSSNRWLIAISEYALISYPDLWDGGRNPRRYTSLEELGISLEGIELQPIQSDRQTSLPSAIREEPRQPELRSVDFTQGLLTIPEAKKALAVTFGVKPEDVEITIRG